MPVRKLRGDIEELKKVVTTILFLHTHHVSYYLILFQCVPCSIRSLSYVVYSFAFPSSLLIPSPLTEMSDRKLRLKKTLNVKPSDHYEFMEELQRVVEHFMGVFKLTVPPYVLGARPTKEERVNVNTYVNMTTVDDALLARIAFFTVYWKKFGYYPLTKTDLSGVAVIPPPPELGDRETELWGGIKKEHGLIHSFLAKYMVREMQPGHHGSAVHHIIPRVTASGEDTKRYPTVMYLPNDETSVFDVQTDNCLENVTLFYEDNSYYHGGILINDIFGPLRHGEGYYRDMSAKTEIHGDFAWNELTNIVKKTEL